MGIKNLDGGLSMKIKGYEETIGNVILGLTSPEQGLDACTLRMIIQRDIFDRYSKAVLDVDRSVLWTNDKEDVVFNPDTWSKVFYSQHVSGPTGFIKKFGGRFFPPDRFKTVSIHEKKTAEVSDGQLTLDFEGDKK